MVLDFKSTLEKSEVCGKRVETENVSSARIHGRLSAVFFTRGLVSIGAVCDCVCICRKHLLPEQCHAGSVLHAVVCRQHKRPL